MKRFYRAILIVVCVGILLFPYINRSKVNATSCSSISDQLGWNQSQSEQLLLPIVQNRKWGYINSTGEIVIPPKFDIVDFFFGGRAAYGDKNNGKWGYINRQGEIVVPARFDKVSRFFNQRAVVTVAGKVGFVAPDGTSIVEPEFDDTTGFYGGNAFVKKNLKWQLIGTSGSPLTNDKFSNVGGFSEGLAPFSGLNNSDTKGFVSLDGRIAIELPENVHPDFERLGFANERGIVYVRAPYHWHQFLNFVSWGELFYGFVDNQGHQVISPQYEATLGFSECLAAVKKRGKYGVINTSGSMIIQPQFDYIGRFSEGFASFEQNHQSGYIDAKGRTVIEPQFYYADIFHEGLARVQVSQNGKWGYIDKTGKFLIAPQFDFGGSFKRGVAQVWIGKQWGYINYSGNFLWSTMEPRHEKLVY